MHCLFTAACCRASTVPAAAAGTDQNALAPAPTADPPPTSTSTAAAAAPTKRPVAAAVLRAVVRPVWGTATLPLRLLVSPAACTAGPAGLAAHLHGAVCEFTMNGVNVASAVLRQAPHSCCGFHLFSGNVRSNCYRLRTQRCYALLLPIAWPQDLMLFPDGELIR